MKTVTCDQCGNDLSDAGPTPKTKLTLTSDWMPTSSSFRNLVAVIPLIPIGNHDFCGASCMVKWIDKKMEARG